MNKFLDWFTYERARKFWTFLFWMNVFTFAVHLVLGPWQDLALAFFMSVFTGYMAFADRYTTSD